jgi:hypothetical protein
MINPEGPRPAHCGESQIQSDSNQTERSNSFTEDDTIFKSSEVFSDDPNMCKTCAAISIAIENPTTFIRFIQTVG